MTIRRKKSFGTNWYFKNPAYSLYPTYGWIRCRRRSVHPALPFSAPSDDSRELGQPYGTYGSKKTISDDFEAPEKISRLTILFAALFTILLVISISCFCAFAIYTSGFSSIPGRKDCSSRITGTVKYQKEVIAPEDLCVTEDCIRIAAHYLNNMNRDVHPCEDFYEFACGSYSKSKPVPENEKRFTIHKEMKDDLDWKLKNLLEQIAVNDTDAMKLAQIYYGSCMDEDSQEALDLLPITQLISNLGGWPLLQNAKFDGTNFKWEGLAGKLLSLGVPTVINLFVHNLPTNTSRYMLNISPPKLLFKKSTYQKPPEKNPYLQHYKAYMMDVLELFGAEREVLEQVVESIINLEIDIASIMDAESSYNQSTVRNQMTLVQFRKTFPKINIDLFLNDELLLYLSPLPGNSVVNVVDIDYFTHLTELLGKTGLSILNDYMLWKFVHSFDTYLPPRYRMPNERFQLRITGKYPKVNWQRCVDLTRNNLGFPLASGYVAKYFSREKKHEVTEMVTDLKASLENTILNADWMDESTRSAALLKLNNMKEKIAFPDFITDMNAILKPYAGLRLTATTFFDNSVNLRKVIVRENMMKLHGPRDAEDWLTPVISADTYHYFGGNEIIFPAGILQYPLFIVGVPGYVNYGAIGMNIGYEFTHGFDDIGAQYDENGNMKMWWHSETERIFNSKKQCFIAQYGSKFEPITERKLDGQLTATENIADNGGLRIAYSAYQIRSTRRPEFHQLPGLANYTDEQLFFIAFANNWCEAIKPSAIENILETSPRSLGMFRVNVPLQNLPAFSQAFQCPIGSGMNPFEKCRIW